MILLNCQSISNFGAIFDVDIFCNFDFHFKPPQFGAEDTEILKYMVIDHFSFEYDVEYLKWGAAPILGKKTQLRLLGLVRVQKE